MFKYLIADTHFKHTNILKYEPLRVQHAKLKGYDDFDELIIDMWNSKVLKDDKILHLGDVAFKDGYKIANRLKGDITLLIGNHDKKEHITYYKKLGWKIIDRITLNIPKAHIIQNYLKEEFSEKQLNNLLLSCLVCDVKNTRVMFSHFPVFNDNPYDEKYSDITKVLEYIFKITKCSINIHGHTHSLKAKEDFCINVCLELNGFEFKDLIMLEKHPKLITLDDYNPMDNTNSRNDLIWAKLLGEDEFTVIDDEVLKAIVKANGEQGEDEILRMVDRGQISRDDAEDVLGDKYELVANRVPCVWDSL